MSRPPSSAAGRPTAPSRTGSPSSSPLQASPVSELMLRFSCPGCQHRLLVSLRHLGRQSQCPHCLTLVQAPPLTPQVVGYDALVPAARPSLPRPSASLRVSSPPGASAPVVAPGLTALLTRFFRFLGGLRLPRLSLPPLRRLPFWMTWAMYLGVFWLLAIQADIEHKKGRPPLFALATLVWLVPRVGWPRSRWLASFFLPTITCPGCHEVMEAVGIWKCGCGYQDHRERHVRRFQCPLCQGRTGRIDCPRCGATILLW
jgi:hypothetical protein